MKGNAMNSDKPLTTSDDPCPYNPRVQLAQYCAWHEGYREGIKWAEAQVTKTFAKEKSA